MRKITISLLASLFCCACMPRTYISKSYDFSVKNRIGVLAFSSPGGAFTGAENLFAKNLLRYGYTVVERAQIESVLGEHNLSMDSYLSPDVTRKIGRILGVDILLMGEVTSYLPEQKKLAYNVQRSVSSEPVFRNQVLTTPEGGTIVQTQYAGQQQRSQRSVQPYEYTIYAQVGVVAKMVDVNTAQIVWVGDDTAQGVSGLDAVSDIAAGLVKSFDKQVKKARKRGEGN